PADKVASKSADKPCGKPADKASGKPTDSSTLAQKPAAPAPNWPGEKPMDKPADKSADKVVMTAAGMPVPAALSPAPPPSPNKGLAIQLMAQGKSLAGAGRYVEARIKFQEATKLNAEFGPDEETPPKCLMD